MFGFLHSSLLTQASPKPEQHWFRYYLIVAAATLAAGAASYPLAQRATLLSLTQWVSPEQAQAALDQSRPWVILGLLCSPLAVLGKGLLYTGILCLFSAMMGRKARFRHLLGVVMATFLLTILEIWCTLLILYVRGIDRLASPDDLKVPLGLDRFLDSSALWAGVAGQLNLFQLGYVVLLGFGFAANRGLRLRTALAGASMLWLLSALVSQSVQMTARNYADLVQ